MQSCDRIGSYSSHKDMVDNIREKTTRSISIQTMSVIDMPEEHFRTMKTGEGLTQVSNFNQDKELKARSHWWRWGHIAPMGSRGTNP